MASELQVEIVTPEHAAFSGPASEVILPAWEGQMGIYPDHDGVLTLLKAGTCEVTTTAGVQRWVVGRGFAEVGPTRVTILTDSCIPVAKVDKSRAATELAEAEKLLAAADVGTERHRQAGIAAEHAQARLDA